MHKAYLGQKQFSVEGLDMTVPMIDEIIQLSATQRRARGRDRDGPPRPAERPRAQPRPSVRARSSPSSRAPRRSSRSRRSRRAGPATSSTTTAPRAPTSCRAASRSSSGSSRTRSHLEFVAPVAVGRDARRADDPPGPARPPGHERGDPDRPARRRRLPRPGRRRRDAQPAGARRLHRRRHDPPDPEQPGRVHDRSGGLALDDLGVRPREGLRRADHPRQRRRRRGLHLAPCGSRSRSARSSATTY